jgi:hypothetical protein
MFVRYRKLSSDGRAPLGVTAARNCPGICKRRRNFHCPKKPRCRWRIGLLRLADPLVPYRLHVSLAENRREAGRVRQEHVADLGTVDGYLLPEFWNGLDPTLVAQIKADNWDLRSVNARLAFWNEAKPRLDRLSNRLDPKAIRMAIHQRIPWPKQAERDLAEAREDFRFWKGLHDMQANQIEAYEKTIETVTKDNAELREEASKSARAAAHAAARLVKLQS